MEREPNRGQKLSQDIDALLGVPSWRSQSQTRFTLRDLFLDRLHGLGYSYLGAINIKTDLEGHQYYLIYASHHQVGAKIMKSNFKIEWGFNLLVEPSLDRFIYDQVI
jgi:hypothetical protein